MKNAILAIFIDFNLLYIFDINDFRNQLFVVLNPFLSMCPNLKVCPIFDALLYKILTVTSNLKSQFLPDTLNTTPAKSPSSKKYHCVGFLNIFPMFSLILNKFRVKYGNAATNCAPLGENFFSGSPAS